MTTLPVGALEPGRLEWDQVETFHVVADSGGFRQAQRKTGQSLETLRRRVDAFEKSLGVKLFRRENTGLRLTEIGREVFQNTAAARDSIAAIGRVTRRSAAAKAGLVSLSAPEGIGIFWLTPRLKLFKARFPDVVLDLNSTMRLADINLNEADITIQYARPKGGNLMCRKLGSLHIIFYCSRDYAREYGLPKGFDDLKGHRIAYQSSEQLDETALLRLFAADDPTGVVQYRVNSSFALYQLARTGVVLTALPSYVSAFREDLIAIDFGGVSYPLELWLAWHPDVQDFEPARALRDWILENFDSQKFPWFKEDYVRAETLASLDCAEWRINMGQFVQAAPSAPAYEGIG